jgi:hypothetical protein
MCALDGSKSPAISVASNTYNETWQWEAKMREICENEPLFVIASRAA